MKMITLSGVICFFLGYLLVLKYLICVFVHHCFHQVDENEIREFFAKYGSVKEVKIITYRGGICKG